MRAAAPPGLARSACPNCGQTGSQPVLHRNGYDLARCQGCGLVYVDPMPTPAALHAHYQDPGYFSGQAEQGYREYADMHRALRPHFERRLHTLEARLGRPGRLLDFGCADGYFLELARARGWQVAGVELASNMAQTAAQRLRVPVATSLEQLNEAEFDVVTLWEVIEHLPDPVSRLRALHGRLRPGGLLMLSTPNTGHWQAVRAPDLWIAYRPPSHLVYFTAATLPAVLERAGFDSVTVQRTGPLPPMPGWLSRASRPLEQALAGGQAQAWVPALLAWRAVRLLAWGWQRLAHPRDDVFATLEALARRPA